LKIISAEVFSRITNKPRKHLGSIRYNPCFDLENPPVPEEGSHPTEFSTCPPLPRFSGQENCTFNVRVSRQYLTTTARLTICQNRSLWGTDIYTDDSDPIAAAIHSGWILGSWPADIDISLLDLGDEEAAKKLKRDAAKSNTGSGPGKDTPATKANAPFSHFVAKAPPFPDRPEDREGKERDLEIKCLVLPTLERYTGTVCKALRSRSWETRHDGLSFRVVGIRWVDGEVEWKPRREKNKRIAKAREGIVGVVKKEGGVKRKADEEEGKGREGWRKKRRRANGVIVPVGGGGTDVGKENLVVAQE
jgi:hypothetical protein